MLDDRPCYRTSAHEISRSISSTTRGESNFFINAPFRYFCVRKGRLKHSINRGMQQGDVPSYVMCFFVVPNTSSIRGVASEPQSTVYVAPAMETSFGQVDDTHLVA
uniref:Uncharacterized protein n=1 Tax=Grammatophora oceanica TaxID=210454 RepID=A0A7S1Y389_9STRA